MSDVETIQVYDDRSDDYAKLAESFEDDPILAHFITACPPGGKVLDLGCGPGTEAAVMASAGLEVEALDASKRMVALANQHEGVNARHGTFDAVEGTDIYDGVWANFSLLHASRADLPGHLSRIKTALKPSGRLHIALKLGEGEARDTLGRLYTYWSEDDLTALLVDLGFEITARALGEGKGLEGSDFEWIALSANA